MPIFLAIRAGDVSRGTKGIPISLYRLIVTHGYPQESEKSIYLVITEMLLALGLQGVRKKDERKNS